MASQITRPPEGARCSQQVTPKGAWQSVPCKGIPWQMILPVHPGGRPAGDEPEPMCRRHVAMMRTRVYLAEEAQRRYADRIHREAEQARDRAEAEVLAAGLAEALDAPFRAVNGYVALSRDAAATLLTRLRMIDNSPTVD